MSTSDIVCDSILRVKYHKNWYQSSFLGKKRGIICLDLFVLLFLDFKEVTLNPFLNILVHNLKKKIPYLNSS
jgi:hypothetical protein